MKLKTVGELEIEPCFEITGCDAMGIVVRQVLSDNKREPLLSIELRSDCENFYFQSRAEVKAFCDLLTEVADEHLNV